MTVNELRDKLFALDPKHDECEVVIWLPGSLIDTGNSVFVKGENVCIEGNIRPGSVLSSD